MADVFRRYGDAYRQQHGASLSTAQRRAMSAIERCRTAALGGHVERCDGCGHQRIAYNSLPQQELPQVSVSRPRAVARDRQAELLDAQYFHVVFTVPDEIAVIAFQNKPVVYDILFRAAAETLRTIAADPAHLGAEIGFLAVLHTWGQNLMHHPHLHCLGPRRRDLAGRQPMDRLPAWLLPARQGSVPAVPRVVPALPGEGLRRRPTELLLHATPLQERPHSYVIWLRRAHAEWVVYAKPPFAGPQQVLDYVGRYTHRIAISNNRLLSIDEGNVRFRWKDYRHGDHHGTMTLDG